MGAVSARLTPPLEAKLAALAARRRTSRAEVVRQALAAYEVRPDDQDDGGEGALLLDRIGDLLGKFHGPGDLSTNPAYMEGFGE